MCCVSLTRLLAYLQSVFGKPHSKESICTFGLLLLYNSTGVPSNLEIRSPDLPMLPDVVVMSLLMQQARSAHRHPQRTCCLTSPSLTHLAVDKHIITSELRVKSFSLLLHQQDNGRNDATPTVPAQPQSQYPEQFNRRLCVAKLSAVCHGRTEVLKLV